MSAGKKKVVIVSAGLIVAAVLVVVLWPGDREPEGPIYHGRSLRTWIERYRESTKVSAYSPPSSPTSVLQKKYELGEWVWFGAEEKNPEAREAAAAIRKIGTNGVPFLIKWIQHRRSGFRRGVDNIAANLSVLDELPADQADLRASDGMIGLQVLGSEASFAVPDLVGLVSSTNSTASERAIWCLLYLGTPALEWFAATLADQRLAKSERMRAGNQIEWMQYVGSAAVVIVPHLLECVRDTNSVVVETAARDLGLFRLASGRSVPALSGCLSSPNVDVRLTAVAALHQFGEDARPAGAALTTCLVDSDLFVRVAATNTLRQIAPETLTNGVSGQH